MWKAIREFILSFFFSSTLLRHFRSLFLSDVLRKAVLQKKSAVPEFQSKSKDLSEASVYQLFSMLSSHPRGLSTMHLVSIRSLFGRNEIQQEKRISTIRHLWVCYCNPFNILLTVIAILSWMTRDVGSTLVIVVMIFFSTCLRFFQELRSRSSAEQLKQLVVSTATVVRRQDIDPAEGELFLVENCYAPSARREVPISELLPGDLILLTAGDMIPADIRVLHAKDLFVNQVSMTGEAMPVEKFSYSEHRTDATLFEMSNICFFGTNVVSGSAVGIVFATGTRTYFGILAQRLLSSDFEKTSFDAGVSVVSWVLIRVMLCASPIVFVLNGLASHKWEEAALFALSIAVGLTPEMLPMIVTSTLASAAVRLSRHKVIVKRLDSVQVFGEMSVLCMDKTGTLTKDKIFLDQYTDAFGCLSTHVLEFAYLNSFYQTGLKNLLDVAVLENVKLNKELQLGTNYQKVDEIPFDFQRRRMSVVVNRLDDRVHFLICKGAAEEVLSVCSHVEIADRVTKLTADLFGKITEIVRNLSKEGLRVVAVAIRKSDTGQKNYSILDEKDLTLIGYISFLDPPKESTAAALRALSHKNIEVKILTGDNAEVTQKICEEVQFTVQGVILGSQIQSLSTAALSEVVANNNVFAKLTPLDKERIVCALRNRKQVVGFIGDGINDAPAMQMADVGVSVDTAVDIAKESADIILLEKDLMILSKGIEEGRRTFVNMLKYIRITASSNFGNIFSVLVASLFLPFLPMLPLHLLTQNLLYDVSQIAIPLDHTDGDIDHPLTWNAKGLVTFMFFFGPLSSIFDLLTFACMWFIFDANSVEKQSLFHSGWFVEGLLSQTLIVHMIRTRKIPFFQSRASWPMIFMTCFSIIVGVVFVQCPIRIYFKFSMLPLSYFFFLVVILLTYMILVQKVKNFYIKHFSWTS